MEDLPDSPAPENCAFDLTRPEDWEQAIEAAGPASLLLLISRRASPALRAAWPAEDILQEALLHAWRSRATFVWRGLQPFRRWLIAIVENRLKDLAERERAEKRGGAHAVLLFSEVDSMRNDGNSGADLRLDIPISTTPGRIASYAEQAEIYRQALNAVPEQQREILYLRIFEQMDTEEVAEQMQIGVQAVRYRLRVGAQLYRNALHRILHSRSRSDHDVRSGGN